MNTCGMGQDTNDIVQASGLDQNGVPFDGTEGEPDDVGPGRINLLGFRYRISFRIVDGSPQITLHWENHTYLYKGVKVVYRFFDDNHRHPRRLDEAIDSHFNNIDVTKNSIQAGEKIQIGGFLLSKNFRKMSILGECYLYTFDMPSFTFLSEYKLNECDE